MQGEIFGPFEKDATPPQDADNNRPPLNLAENAKRIPLYEELAVVLHNVRIVRFPEVGPEEMEEIKKLTETDTKELKLPKRSKGARSQEDDIPPRVKRAKERKKEVSKEQKVRDALQRFGNRPS